jgi:hypothetical protein
MGETTKFKFPVVLDEENQPLPLWQASFDNWGQFDPAKIDPRKWIYGKHYQKGVVSATIADGGMGKSVLALTEAIAIVTRRPLLGVPVTSKEGERDFVLYYNAEEPLEEIQRRVYAICQHYGVNPEELVPDHGDPVSGGGLTVAMELTLLRHCATIHGAIEPLFLAESFRPMRGSLARVCPSCLELPKNDPHWLGTLAFPRSYRR